MIELPTIVTLPSGAILKIGLSPFADAKALYQTLLRELKAATITSQIDFTALVKDVICIGFSSQAVDIVLAKCMQRCTIDYGNGDMKIDSETFEPVEARGDYVKVCVEVVKANVAPFMMSLYADFKTAVSMMDALTPES